MWELILRFLGDYTVRNVLLGTAWIGVVSGMVGSLALLRRQSLLGDVLSHATLPGVVLAFLLWRQRDMGLLMTGAAVAGLLAALLIFVVDVNTRIPRDGAMGLTLALFFGLGLFLLSRVQNLPSARKAGLDKLIFGQAAALVESDIIALVVAGLPVLLVMLLFWKELKVVTFDPLFAGTLGLPVRWLELLILVLIVVTTVIGLQAVGVVLMSAMLIAPAAAARQWTDRMSHMVLIASLVGAASGTVGAVISSIGPHISTGPVVVLALTVFVIGSLLFGARRGLVWRWLAQWRRRARFRTELVLEAMYELWMHHDDKSHGHAARVIQLTTGQRGNTQSALESLSAEGLVQRLPNNSWILTEGGVSAVRTRRNRRNASDERA